MQKRHYPVSWFVNTIGQARHAGLLDMTIPSLDGCAIFLLPIILQTPRQVHCTDVEASADNQCSSDYIEKRPICLLWQQLRKLSWVTRITSSGLAQQPHHVQTLHADVVFENLSQAECHGIDS